MATFPIWPPARFAGHSEPVRRPKEFACFSYDENHELHLDDSSLRWYYTPPPDANLSKGYETFVQNDGSVDEHLDSLLKTIADHEKRTGKPIDAHVVTWRGLLTKIMAAPYEARDGHAGFEMNATLYQGCIFIEENHGPGTTPTDSTPWKGPISQEMMTFWGYKFETIATIPRPWGQTSRDVIESREDQVVSNKQQYCSVVRTGFGKTILCLGGEVDAIWDAKPKKLGDPIDWVELKTSVEIRSDRDRDNFTRKLLRYWIQSFLLGVPRIIVGFRSRTGFLRQVDEFETVNIPTMVQQSQSQNKWDGNVCVNCASGFLQWLRETITDEGVWRIRKQKNTPFIEVFKVEDVGHGRIITDEFMDWRIKLSLSSQDQPSPP